MANESIRIRTTPGQSKNINFKLEQDFDFLEILSLKISQEDLYQTFCSNYGVIVGRVLINKGFGVPNAKVSVFIPISDEDEKNVIIKDYYPYKTPYQKRESDGIRYNLLLSKTTCDLNTPVGTFPTKEEVLDNDVILEVFEKYYKFTTKTNGSGDFMIFGVPVGQHTVHMDVDLSDSGAFSIRPYDMIANGYPENLFQSKNKFKQSVNLDNLPQIITGNISVDVIPFWGDPESCEIGITRVDFDTNYNSVTTSLFFGSVITDNGKLALDKGCDPANKQGELRALKPAPGSIRMIRVSDYDPIKWFNESKIDPLGLEKFDIDNGELIDQDGNFAFALPLNLGHVITSEEGLLIPSRDPATGVPTKGMYRFAMKLNEPDQNVKYKTATMLFPSLGPDFGGTQGLVNNQNPADTNGTEDQRFTTDICQYNLDPDKCDGQVYPNSRIFLDFHLFEWKQVYTIANYIKKYKKGNNRRSFIGIKNTGISDESLNQNPFPFSNAIWVFDLLYYLQAGFIDYVAFFIKLWIQIISFCITICIRLRVAWGTTVAGVDIGFDITLIDIGFRFCPFAPLSDLTPKITLPCEGAPNGENYTIPEDGNWYNCNADSCGGVFTCTVDCAESDYNIIDTNFFDFGVVASGALNENDSPCLNNLEDWKCCVKYELTKKRNTIHLTFVDSWVFGTAYFFQFKIKRKETRTGRVKEKFCGFGNSTRSGTIPFLIGAERGGNFRKNRCCLETPYYVNAFFQADGCRRCLVRGPGPGTDDVPHAYAVTEGKVGSADLKEHIYCNTLGSTKIVSLGSIDLCQETLEDIKKSIQTNQILQQTDVFYTGTFYEQGWDPTFWVNYLDSTSYNDPEKVIRYLGTRVNCKMIDLFLGNSPKSCHEYELTDNSYFIMKEVSKIYTDIQEAEIPQNEGEFGSNTTNTVPIFNPNTNPYYDYTNDPAAFGGFSVDLITANRFSPCKGGNGFPANCTSYDPSNPLVGNWINDGTAANLNPEEANSNSWDQIRTVFERNNRNTRSNIPYYYFGLIPGNTAIDKLKREFFLNNREGLNV